MKTYIKPTTKNHHLFTPHHMLLTSGTAGAPSVNNYGNGGTHTKNEDDITWE